MISVACRRVYTSRPVVTISMQGRYTNAVQGVLVKNQVYVCPSPVRSAVLGQLSPMIHVDGPLKQFHAALTKLGPLMTFGPTALRGLLHPQAYKICITLQKYLCRYWDVMKQHTRAFPNVCHFSTEESNDSMGGGGGGGGGGGSGHSDGGNNVFIIRLQGLPYKVTQGEIVDFFSSCAKVKDGTNGVLVMHYMDGKATGDAFALFDNEEEFTRALQLNKSMIGNRYVELFDYPQTHFEMVLSRLRSSDVQHHFRDMLGLEHMPELDVLGGSEMNCVKLRGVPYSTNTDDVIGFFGDLKEEIATQGVHMVLNAMNNLTGECYVQMKSFEAARDASTKLHRKYIDTRYIEVFQCSGDEVRDGLQDGIAISHSGHRGLKGHGDRGAGVRYDEGRWHPSGGSSVKVRGLPFNTREEELCNFFADYDVKESQVAILLNRYGRPSGLAHVMFPSRDVAQQAIREKNGKHIGSRYLELSLAQY